MDYARVYSDLISSRRRLESALVGSGEYFERHHITPKFLGGADVAENLISLTPEDHFFAHLLLAKIHGGRLWAPVALMVGGTRKDYRPTVSRVAHGWAVRAMAQAASGSAAHQFDRATHSLVHTEGARWCGLQSEMPAAIGLSKSMANMVIKGRVSVAKGWSLAGAERKTTAGDKHGMYRSEVHEFVHVDGRTFTGTQFAFSETGAVSRPAASLLARGKASIKNGWHLKGATLPKLGRGAKWRSYQSNLPEASGFAPSSSDT